MDESDVEALARLHVACLSDSLVTTLGARYARSFYRYVTQSTREVIVTERDAAGHIVAAAVITLEPSTFYRRLALHTSLLPSLVWNIRVMPALLWSSLRRSDLPRDTRDPPAESPRPEMILIFTAPDVRRQGHAGAIVRRAEHRLGQLGIPAYQVRTVLSPSNEALAFYRDLRFVPSGTSVRFGVRFQIFTKRLSDGQATAGATGPAEGSAGHTR